MEHVVGRGMGEGSDGREPRHKAAKISPYRRNSGLLKHDLAEPDAIGIRRLTGLGAPGQRPAMSIEPAQQVRRDGRSVEDGLGGGRAHRRSGARHSLGRIPSTAAGPAATIARGSERDQMAVGEESEKRRGKMRPVGRELPRIAGRVLGKRGLGEAQLLAEWSAVVGDELAAETLPMKLSFPAGGRRNGVLKLRVTSAAALSVQHREPQILERINGSLGYGAVARLALVQGPLPKQASVGPRPRRALSPAEAASLARRVSQVPDPGLKSALERLGAAILAERNR